MAQLSFRRHHNSPELLRLLLQSCERAEKAKEMENERVNWSGKRVGD